MTTVGSSDDADRLILATLVVQAEELLEEERDERTRELFERAARMPEPWRRHLVHKVMVKTFGPVAS